jgi:hypothetical protein
MNDGKRLFVMMRVEFMMPHSADVLLSKKEKRVGKD